MPGRRPSNRLSLRTLGSPPCSERTAPTYRKFSSIRRAACNERARADPPREAIRLLCAADSRCARIRPPRRPIALAMSRTFTTVFYLTLSIISRARSAICIFESGAGGWLGVAGARGVPLHVLALMPFARSFRWAYLCFSYVIPIVPLLLMWSHRFESAHLPARADAGTDGGPASA